MLVHASMQKCNQEIYRKLPPLKHRPYTTYNKTDIKKSVNFISLECQNGHRFTTDEFHNLQSAIDALHSHQHHFQLRHEKCGKIIAIPTHGYCKINIKCTTCSYNHPFETNIPPKIIELQSRIMTRSLQHGNRPKRNLSTGCLRPNCRTCKVRSRNTSYTDKDGREVFIEKFNCKHKNLIYIAHCKLCNVNYIGLTTTSINLRINNHMASIKNEKKIAISTHFNRHGIHNLQFGIIESRSDTNMEELRIMEAYWIHRFNTFQQGLNTKNEVDIIIHNQLLIAVKHFQHNMQCIQYIAHRIYETKQDQLKN